MIPMTPGEGLPVHQVRGFRNMLFFCFVLLANKQVLAHPQNRLLRTAAFQIEIHRAWQARARCTVPSHNVQCRQRENMPGILTSAAISILPLA